jgi:hypothetical protein
MKHVPARPFLTLAPDWVAEIVSPSTEAQERGEKMTIYAREAVRHAWLVDPTIRTLELFRLDGEAWRALGTWRGDVKVRPEPLRCDRAWPVHLVGGAAARYAGIAARTKHRCCGLDATTPSLRFRPGVLLRGGTDQVFLKGFVARPGAREEGTGHARTHAPGSTPGHLQD